MTSIALETEYTSKDAQIVVEEYYGFFRVKLHLPSEYVLRAVRKLSEWVKEIQEPIFEAIRNVRVISAPVEEDYEKDQWAYGLFTFEHTGKTLHEISVNVSDGLIMINEYWPTSEVVLEDWPLIASIVKRLIS